MRSDLTFAEATRSLPLSALPVPAGASASTVSDCVARAQVAGLSWPLPEDLDDEQLEARLFPRTTAPHPRPEPDYARLHKELRRKGVTLRLLWQEYRAEHPDQGLEYSAFCERYRKWRKGWTW